MTTSTGQSNIAKGSRELPEHDRSPLAVAQLELAERWQLIERLAAYLANPKCDGCEGSGIDWEGSEWSLCDEAGCALPQLRDFEARG